MPNAKGGKKFKKGKKQTFHQKALITRIPKKIKNMERLFGQWVMVVLKFSVLMVKREWA